MLSLRPKLVKIKTEGGLNSATFDGDTTAQHNIRHNADTKTDDLTKCVYMYYRETQTVQKGTWRHSFVNWPVGLTKDTVLSHLVLV